MSELSIELPPVQNGIVHWVSFQQLDAIHDTVPNVRLYCTMHNQHWNLQIRATVPLNGKGNSKKARNLVATAGLNWQQLQQIADYVDQVRKKMASDESPQERYTVKPAELILQGLESNGSEFNDEDRSALITILAMVRGGAIRAAREVIDASSDTVKYYASDYLF